MNVTVMEIKRGRTIIRACSILYLCMTLMISCFLYSTCLSMQPFQPHPPCPSLAGWRWMANAVASSSVQPAVVAASSMPVPPNQGIEV